MTESEKEILARLTVLDQLFAFLMSRHLASRSPEISEGIKNSFLNNPHTLPMGALMDATDLQDVGERTESHLSRILEHASQMESVLRG